MQSESIGYPRSAESRPSFHSSLQRAPLLVITDITPDGRQTSCPSLRRSKAWASEEESKEHKQ